MTKRPNIFTYNDYRRYLADLFVYLKATKKSFSHRNFAMKAGFSSPNMLQQVISGRRNITLRTLQAFIKGLDLNQQEAEFFPALVAFGQAQNAHEKSVAYQNMTKSRKFREVHQLNKELYEYYSNWFNVVIREMAGLPGFEADPAWVSAHVFPKISKEEAARAIQLLVKLDLLQEDPTTKRLKRKDALVATPPEVKSLAVIAFHQSMLKLASEAITTVAREERDVTSATVIVSREGIGRIKKKVERFRKQLLAECEASEKDADQVYQLNIQLFPVSRPTKEKL